MGYELDAPSPIDAIKFRMEQSGLTRKDPEETIGGRGRISEVLSGKRALSLSMIRKLNDKLGLLRPCSYKEGAPLKWKSLESVFKTYA